MKLSPLATRILPLAALALLAILLITVLTRPAPAATPTATAPPTAAPSPTPPPSPTPAPTPAPTPTPAPHLEAEANAGDGALAFHLRGRAPQGAREALLWFDTAAGRQVRRVVLDAGQQISATLTLDAEQALAPGDLGAAPRVDYWWAVRGADGRLLRRAGTLDLPPEIAAIGQAQPPTPTIDLDWVERATPHFRLFAPPGSDGARDLMRLAQVAEAGYVQAATVISPTQAISVEIYLVPRVFWQGGVAYGESGPLIISYLDRNYAGVEPWSYFVHEVAHALGAALLPEGAEVGGVLGEGVAVYVTGGHYDIEPIDARAATLADSDLYVPLCELRYDFYAAQHEAAYTESASFVRYLVRTYGLDTFLALYRAQQPQRGEREVSVAEFCAQDNARLAGPTGKTQLELEREWLAYLDTLTPTESQRRSWELTVRLYDTMRRYQEQLDPPARTLPPPPDEWDDDLTYQFLTPASGRRAAMLETLLVAAGDALDAGELERTAALLDSVEASLEAGGAPADALARDYHALVILLEAQARALRLGDARALGATLAEERLARRLPFGTDDLLHDLRLVPVWLDVRGEAAEGVVEVWGSSMNGRRQEGELYRARFARSGGRWVMTAWESYAPEIALPPGPGVIR
ncbi:MAG TPA: hypothetical protein VNL77_07855 [Roseiflexaceae bacterium]|nr:hypothetical protein [Roseiflexaceae bacterium]